MVGVSTDDVLFINASAEGNFEKGKRQNHLRDEDIEKIVSTYQNRSEEERYSKCVSLEVIAKENDYNLNISRYISTSEAEKQVDLDLVHQTLTKLSDQIAKSTMKHNEFLKELGLKILS